MKDEELEKVYSSFTKFYLTCLIKLKRTFDSKECDETFHWLMSKNDYYDKDQVDRIINKKEE